MKRKNGQSFQFLIRKGKKFFQIPSAHNEKSPQGEMKKSPSLLFVLLQKLLFLKRL